MENILTYKCHGHRKVLKIHFSPEWLTSRRWFVLMCVCKEWLMSVKCVCERVHCQKCHCHVHTRPENVFLKPLCKWQQKYLLNHVHWKMLGLWGLWKQKTRPLVWRILLLELLLDKNACTTTVLFHNILQLSFSLQSDHGNRVSFSTAIISTGSHTQTLKNVFVFPEFSQIFSETLENFTSSRLQNLLKWINPIMDINSLNCS